METKDLKIGTVLKCWEGTPEENNFSVTKITDKRVSYKGHNGYSYKANINRIATFWLPVKTVNKYLESGHWKVVSI